MTHRTDKGVVFIYPEAPRTCDRCKQEKETRDILENGSRVCFGCATEAERDAYTKRLFGPNP